MGHGAQSANDEDLDRGRTVGRILDQLEGRPQVFLETVLVVSLRPYNPPK
jgi:hypothetical protein